MLRSRDSSWTKNSFSRNQKLRRTTDRNRKIYSIQLSIAIQTDCAVILSRIVQSRKRARVWKTTKQKLQRKASKASYLSSYNDESTYVISIIRSHWRLQRQASIVSSPRLFTAVTANQEHQSSWKSLRILLKHSCEMNLSYITLKSSSSNFRTMTSIIRSFCFHCRDQKSKSRTSITDRTTISTKA